MVHTAPLAQELLAGRPVIGNGREATVIRLMQQHARECVGGTNPYVKPGRLLQVLHKLNPRQVQQLGSHTTGSCQSGQSMNDETSHCRAA